MEKFLKYKRIKTFLKVLKQGLRINKFFTAFKDIIF